MKRVVVSTNSLRHRSGTPCLSVCAPWSNRVKFGLKRYVALALMLLAASLPCKRIRDSHTALRHSIYPKIQSEM